MRQRVGDGETAPVFEQHGRKKMTVLLLKRSFFALMKIDSIQKSQKWKAPFHALKLVIKTFLERRSKRELNEQPAHCIRWKVITPKLMRRQFRVNYLRSITEKRPAKNFKASKQFEPRKKRSVYLSKIAVDGDEIGCYCFLTATFLTTTVIIYY